MKSTKLKLNVKLLRRVKRHILEEPRRFVMYTLVQRGKPGAVYEADTGRTTYAACGTAACIAGWASLLSGVKNPTGTDGAARRLGLDFRNPDWEKREGQTQAASVFYDFYWPEPFQTKYQNAKRPLTRAKIAAARIEHLITTGE